MTQTQTQNQTAASNPAKPLAAMEKKVSEAQQGQAEPQPKQPVAETPKTQAPPAQQGDTARS